MFNAEVETTFKNDWEKHLLSQDTNDPARTLYDLLKKSYTGEDNEEVFGFESKPLVLDSPVEDLNSTDECQESIERVQYEIAKEEFRLKWIEDHENEFKSDLKKPSDGTLSKKEQKQKNIVNETLYTEKNYIAALDILMKVYIKPLRARTTGAHPIVSNEELNQIFYKIEDIHAHHVTLCAKMEDLINNWTEQSKLSSLFLDLSSLFDDYLKFVGNYSKSLACLRSCRKSNSTFVEYVDDVFLNVPMNKNRYRIQDVMIMPIQRIPRYALLLESYAKAVGPDHHDYNDLLIGEQRAKETAALINEGQRYAHSVEEVYNLSLVIVGDHDPIDIPGRRVLKQDRIVDVSDSRRKWHDCILFNDSVFLCKKKNEELRSLWQVRVEEAARVEKYLFAVDQREVNSITKALADTEKELQAESNRVNNQNKGNKIPGTSKLLDGLRLRLAELEDKLKLSSYTFGIRLYVEGKRHRVFTALFATEEDRDEWYKLYSATKHQIETEGPVTSPQVIPTAVTAGNGKKSRFRDLLKSKNAVPTVSGRLCVKIYGATICANGVSKVVFHLEVDNNDGEFTSKGRAHLTNRVIVEKASDIPNLQILKMEVRDIRHIRFSLKDASNQAISHGNCVLQVNQIEVSARDWTLPLFRESNITNDQVQVQISFIPGRA